MLRPSSSNDSKMLASTGAGGRAVRRMVIRCVALFSGSLLFGLVSPAGAESSLGTSQQCSPRATSWALSSAWLRDCFFVWPGTGVGVSAGTNTMSRNGYALAQRIVAAKGKKTDSWAAATEGRLAEELKTDKLLSRGAYQIAHCSSDGCIALVDSQRHSDDEVMRLSRELAARLSDLGLSDIQMASTWLWASKEHFTLLVIARHRRELRDAPQ